MMSRETRLAIGVSRNISKVFKTTGCSDLSFDSLISAVVRHNRQKHSETKESSEVKSQKQKRPHPAS